MATGPGVGVPSADVHQQGFHVQVGVEDVMPREAQLIARAELKCRSDVLINELPMPSLTRGILVGLCCVKYRASAWAVQS